METIFADGKERNIMNREEVMQYFRQRSFRSNKCLVSIGITVFTNLKYLILRECVKKIHQFEPKAFYIYLIKQQKNGLIEFTSDEFKVESGYHANKKYTMMYFDWIMEKLYPVVEEHPELIESPALPTDLEFEQHKLANDKIVEITKNMMNEVIEEYMNYVYNIERLVELNAIKIKDQCDILTDNLFYGMKIEHDKMIETIRNKYKE